MPKIDIDYETLDGIVAAALKDLLCTTIEAADLDDEYTKENIAAIKRVLRMYE